MARKGRSFGKLPYTSAKSGWIGTETRTPPDRSVLCRVSPCMVVSDNGTGLTSNAMLKWQEDSQMEWHYIAPGKPLQNGLVDSLHCRPRNECRNEHLFPSLRHATYLIAAWRHDNTLRYRPPSSQPAARLLSCTVAPTTGQAGRQLPAKPSTARNPAMPDARGP